MRKKETLKCMPSFNDRDPWPACLFTTPAKSHLSSGVLPRSLHPQDPQLQPLNLPMSLLWAFILDWKEILLEDWIQPYYSKLLLSIMWYFSPVFIFQTIFACSLSQWLSHSRTSDNLWDSSLWIRSMGERCLWPSCAGDLQIESWSLG